MNLDQALTQRPKLEGIQWLLLSAGPQRILRHQLKSLPAAPSLLGPCRRRRVRFKPGRKLTATYDALVRNKASTTYRARPIAVTWGAPDQPDRGPAQHAVGEMEGEAHSREVAWSFERLAADLTQLNMHISVSPLDPHFTQLVRLMDPLFGGKMLTVVSPGSASGSTRAFADKCAVTSIRYRPGQRHVLRYDHMDKTKTTAFAKLYRGEDGAHALLVATQAAGCLEQQEENCTAVRPLDYLAAIQLVKITARRVPLFDRKRTSRTERMIECAHGVMCRLELMMGIPAKQALASSLGKEHAAHA